MSDIGPALLDYLFDHLADACPADRKRSHWVMNVEWWRDCVRMADSHGRPLWQPSVDTGTPPLLFGLPIEIRPDGGVPHLEIA